MKDPNWKTLKRLQKASYHIRGARLAALEGAADDVTAELDAIRIRLDRAIETATDRLNAYGN